MSEHEISKAVVKRLPRYYRYLGDLLNSKVERISSNELSDLMNVTASQIRQDLNNFGGFGQQGYGYNVKYLYNEIGKIIGLDKSYNMVVVGGGHLGQAIANYVKFEKRGFSIKGIFDNNPELNGQLVRGIPIRMTEELPRFLQENEIQIAALTLPKTGAEMVAPILVENGVKAICNFAVLDLQVQVDVVVEYVHLSV
ncbi:MAG: redox-sensing transcriptional repressor Rex, partial [Lachnospiraceae bacterium]|nr:redox-sensing transcriptional repressor Rex [Lachnospiraceae bacterium]